MSLIFALYPMALSVVFVVTFKFADIGSPPWAIKYAKVAPINNNTNFFIAITLNIIVLLLLCLFQT